MNNLKSYLSKNKAIAILAPSFPIDFKYPNIIGALYHLGFDKVTEVTFGARMTNYHYIDYVKNHPNQKYYIASPCPTLKTLVQTKYPDLEKYLIPISSPMLSMAKIYKHRHPKYKIVFISPCFAKRELEARYYKNTIDHVVTFSELLEVFNKENIILEKFNRKYYFDSLITEYTKVYPISGGLAKTSHLSKVFPGKICVADTPAKNIKILEDILSEKTDYRFFDLLNCPGGCIGGPAINSKHLSIKQRKNKVLDYVSSSSRDKMGKHRGKLEYAQDVDFNI